ncbi:hypothetical protein HK104_010233 [Borealophlyctis nickersoniae]|nr:hypothetical protein HK104_010233 [Borealophlyctis nickersoniae]
MDAHTRLPVQRYNSRFMEPLPQDVDLVIAQSPMGSGKTYSIAKFITEMKPKRVLLVSSRRTYAENATADLNNRLPKEFAFQKYNNVEGSLGHVSFLTVQMESLHRLKNAPPYDILVIDEVEACFKQFSSPTMLTSRRRLVDNLQVFEEIYKSAGKKILLDAFISQRTIDFAEWMATKQLGRGRGQPEQTEQMEQVTQTAQRNGILVVNENMPRARNAYQYSSHPTWEDVLVRKLDEGKRLVIFWGSKKKGDDFEKFLNERYPHLTVKFYTSESDDLLDKDLENIRDSWKDVDVLMYTAKITVGVNFDTENVFDSLFVYGAAGGCSAREVIQATMRVRHLRDDTIHYFISGGGYRGTEVSNLESLLAKKHKYLDDISVDMSVISRRPNLQNDSHHHQLLQMVEWGEEKE